MWPASRSLDAANSTLLTGRLVTMEFLGAPVGTALFAAAHVLPFSLATVCFALSALLIFGVRGTGTRTPGQGRPWARARSRSRRAKASPGCGGTACCARSA